MNKPTISIIAAIGKNRELGKDNKLLWHIPADLKRFQKITLSHPVIMGRKTFESIGKALPGRINIIITENKKFKVEDCIVCHSLGDAVKIASKKDKKEIFIIGGGQIYNQAINLADKLYLTIVQGNFDADTFFPDYSRFNKVIRREEGKYKQYRYTFLELEKLSTT